MVQQIASYDERFAEEDERCRKEVATRLSAAHLPSLIHPNGMGSSHPTPERLRMKSQLGRMVAESIYYEEYRSML